MELGITSVAAITVICYLVGEGCKASKKISNQWIPVICGCVGGLAGLIGLKVIADFPASDVINALAVGIVSGFASTGINQVYKQLSKPNE